MIQAILVNAAMVIVSLAIPWAIFEYQKRTGIQITDQQRNAIYNALNTAKGMLQTQLDQGRLRISDITPSSTAVVEAAKAALARVPDSAKAQATSVASAAEIIIGRLDTSPKPPVVMVAPLPNRNS